LTLPLLELFDVPLLLVVLLEVLVVVVFLVVLVTFFCTIQESTGCTLIRIEQYVTPGTAFWARVWSGTFGSASLRTK
jgi:hypothetical protein